MHSQSRRPLRNKHIEMTVRPVRTHGLAEPSALSDQGLHSLHGNIYRSLATKMGEKRIRISISGGLQADVSSMPACVISVFSSRSSLLHPFYILHTIKAIECNTTKILGINHALLLKKHAHSK